MADPLARWEAVKALVATIGRAHVRAGVVGPPAQEPHAGGPATNGEIALWMELGTRHVPARSFVQATLRDPGVRAELARLESRLVAGVIAGKIDRDRALGLIGAFVASEIQSTIADDRVEGPALAPATVAAKGSEKLLVDFGQLAGAVSWELVK